MLQRLEKRSLLPRATRHRWACMPPAQGSLIPGITTAVSSATAQQHHTRAFQRCYCSSHCSHKTLPSPFKNFLKRIYLGGGRGGKWWRGNKEQMKAQPGISELETFPPDTAGCWEERKKAALWKPCQIRAGAARSTACPCSAPCWQGAPFTQPATSHTATAVLSQMNAVISKTVC